jgi:exosortase
MIRPVAPVLATARELPLRAVAVIGLVLLAYNYSLLTLARGLTLQTPLAYLGLVPVIAIGLAIARLRLEGRELPIHDRQLDWILSLLALAASALILIVLPNSTSSTFWLRRIDLLTLPLFVFGVVTLFFGVRRAWSLRFPIAFLLLAWPVPYTVFMADATGAFTDVTASVVGFVSHLTPVATQSARDLSSFTVHARSGDFLVSIGSACAGMNGFVGFLILGTAFLYLVRGPMPRRLAWLATGLALVFALNVVRILAILVAGAAFGQAAALDVLHPAAGLVVFAVGVVGMMALVPVFGLRYLSAQDIRPRSDDHRDGAAHRVRAAMIVALVFAVGLGITNATYARFETISAGLGEARMQAFDATRTVLPGWHARYIVAFASAKQYFGGSATWDRVEWWPEDDAALYSSRIVYVDVISTDDPGTFAAFGVQACYSFHGYHIESVADADIGAGVRGQVITYANDKVHAYWSALWWEWPYTENGVTRYARVVVMMNEGQDTTFRGITAAPIDTQSPLFAESDRFLVSLGRAIVNRQMATVARS